MPLQTQGIIPGAKSGPLVMDFVNWPSSQSDLSVLEASGPPVQDKDEPVTVTEMDSLIWKKFDSFFNKVHGSR